MRRFIRRGPMRRGADRPERRWVSLNTGWSTGTLSATTTQTVMNMEMPTNTTALTSAFPEDLTIMRIMGEFDVTMTGAADWVMYLLVADASWTSGGFAADADKRILWSQAYQSFGTGFTGYVLTRWSPPGQLYQSATASQVTGCPRNAVSIDIKPKVKIGAGQSLFLVSNELTGAATFEVNARTMRALVQMSRRR